MPPDSVVFRLYLDLNDLFDFKATDLKGLFTFHSMQILELPKVLCRFSFSSV